MNALADLTRRLDNLLRLGTIAQVDHGDPDQGKPPACRVQSGQVLSGWLPWFALRAAAVRKWSPPSVGEQCLVFSPSGDLAAGVVLLGLNSAQHPAPSNTPTEERTQYADGTWVGYDMGSKEMTVMLTAGGKLILTAPGGVQINGNININGKVTTTEDVVAGGISVMHHKTTGVTPGNGLSGDPQ
ncbi:phage baseplate assembly protein V [Halopseudomonas phragmitis]|nr:phage baseplate assembly protein V [Halopseudomonas phragmitis]